MPEYRIPQAAAKPSLKGLWDEAAWKDAPVGQVSNYHSRSSEHHPRVEFKVTYEADALYVFFRVADRYVRVTRTDYNASVCRDSCVEFFVQPKPDKGYFNFEVNGGGTLLLYYIEDPTPGPSGFNKMIQVPGSQGRQVEIYHSLPKIVYPEFDAELDWRVEYRIPISLFEAHVGPLGSLTGQTWRANFYKCADDSSHPHWASWSRLGEKLSFHLPQYFAPIVFT